jgi:hypothetical protein
MYTYKAETWQRMCEISQRRSDRRREEGDGRGWITGGVILFLLLAIDLVGLVLLALRTIL